MNDKYKQLSDYGKFVYGFRKLIEESHLKIITQKGEGLISFKFADGSKISAETLMKDCYFN